jgi:hypothetical protein
VAERTDHGKPIIESERPLGFVVEHCHAIDALLSNLDANERGNILLYAVAGLICGTTPDRKQQREMTRNAIAVLRQCVDTMAPIYEMSRAEAAGTAGRA